MIRSKLALAATLVVSACAQDETLTFDEFVAQAYQEPDTGVYVVNGDEIAEDLNQMRDVYARYLDTLEAADGDGIGESRSPLIVNRVRNRDDRWDDTSAQNLTYCVQNGGSGGFSAAEYSAVVSAFNAASSDWEASADVDFVHVNSLDGDCSRRTGVVFNVRRVCTGQYLARAFFPSTKRNGREVLVDCTSFANISPWTLGGIMRHELGHTIGFRHEHTRPESGTCFEDNSWRALTAYDSSSVMHYPQCNGTQNGDLVLTALDRQGAGILYP